MPRKLLTELQRLYPDLQDPERLVREGRILVDGFPVRNPRSLLRTGASIRVVEPHRLRGQVKLEHALRAFGVAATGRVALDVGAAAGGFTKALLDAGARTVYAVDAGHGQLLGSLRQDPRVVNLEGTNLGQLDPSIVPETIELVTIDVSYLALARAVPQLEPVSFAPDAELVALVKPMFELGLASPPTDASSLGEAAARATAGIETSGWRVRGSLESPVRGAGGAIEFLVHAARESASLHLRGT